MSQRKNLSQTSTCWRKLKSSLKHRVQHGLCQDQVQWRVVLWDEHGVTFWSTFERSIITRVDGTYSYSWIAITYRRPNLSLVMVILQLQLIRITHNEHTRSAINWKMRGNASSITISARLDLRVQIQETSLRTRTANFSLQAGSRARNQD